MPVADHAPRRSSLERLRIARDRALAREIADHIWRMRKRRDGEAGESVPVDPNRPSTLTGGAAAALTFDE